MSIATHDGCFHTDEVVACMILKKLFPNYTIVRTREQKLLNLSHIVVDVGKVYNPGAFRFDHHQESCTDVWTPEAVSLLSSAGMIWRHFGGEILEKFELKEEDLQKIHNDFYWAFFLELDANDNGVDQYSSNEYRKFAINTTLVSTVSRLNSKNVFDHKQQMIQFEKAMKYAELTFDIHLSNFIDKYLSYKEDFDLMEHAFLDCDGKILVIEKDVSNWLLLLKQIESKHHKEGSILFVVYPRESDWGVRTVSLSGFVARKDLAEELVLKSATSSLVFAHKARFIAVCNFKEDAINCAKISL